MKPIKKYLEHQSILIVGAGREGVSACKFFSRFYPHLKISLADRDSQLEKKLDKNVKSKISDLYLGASYLQTLKDYSLVIRSPGVSPYQSEFINHLKPNTLVSSSTQVFFDHYPGQIIGITGTKGKSTTAALTHHIFTHSGIDSYIGGNIGQPCLNLFFKKTKPGKVILELSSHQLIEIDASPYIAVITNLYPEHLDFYPNLKHYYQAKQNITKFQTANDLLILGTKDQYLIDLVSNTSAKTVIAPPSKIFTKNPDLENHLPLSLHPESINIAYYIARHYNINPDQILAALTSFPGLPHRLEYVDTKNGVKYYNDSLATIPQATIKAISKLGSNLHTLIVGGYDRNHDYQTLANHIINHSNIKTIIGLPDTGYTTTAMIRSHPSSNISTFHTDNLADAINIASRNTPSGKICLLSPASASFNLFKDYADRGDQYKKAIKQVNETK